MGQVADQCHRAARLLLPLLLLAQAPQPAPTTSDAPKGDDIVVTAKTREAVDRLVASMTQSKPGKQIARWHDSICPRAIGIEPAQAAFVTKRVSDVARTLKIRVGKGKCPANIVIVFTDDPNGFASALTERYPRLFGDPAEGLARHKDRQDLLQPRPVRWTSASRTTGPAGVPLSQRLNPIYSASRLVRTTQEASAFSLIIVDVARLRGFTWGQLSAYLTMVALARPDMDGDYGRETILSLFGERRPDAPAATDLTEQDRNLLTALYRTDPGLSAEAQRANIRAALRRVAAADPGK